MKKIKPRLWPKYIEKKFKSQTIAGFSSPDMIITEQNDRFSCPDVSSLIIHLFDKNLLLYVRKFPDIPYLSDIWKIARDTWCDEFGNVRCIIIEGQRRSTRLIVAIESWGYATPIVDVLKELRLTFSYLGVGTPSTPGSAGQALMRLAWKYQFADDWWNHRHRRPPCPAIDDLREHAPGPRIEVFSNIVYKKAWELDLRSAYLHYFRQVPTGICSRTYKESCKEHLVYFTEVTVTILTPLPIGFFPVKSEDGIFYPTELGTYHVWLWSMQVAFAEKYFKESVSIQYTGPGWAWDEMTKDTEGYTLLMEWLRDNVPDYVKSLNLDEQTSGKLEETISRHVKLVTTAGMGRHNLPDKRYQIIENGELGADKPVVSNGSAYDFWIHETIDPHPVTMPHWFYFVVICCNIAVTRLALKYREYLLAIRTDSIVVSFEADVTDFIDKNSEKIDTGEWGKTLLTNVNISNKSGLLSDQKVRLPGVKKDVRVNKKIDELREKYG